MSLPLLHAGRTNPGLSAALDLRFALDKSLTAYRGPTPSFSRASTGSYFDGSGVLWYASINIQSYSEDFSNAYWTKANSSVLTDQTASPDGKNTADKLVENSSTAFHQIYNTGFSTTSGSPATISVYVKAAGRQFVQFYISSNMGNGYANFDIVNGTLGTVSGTGITAAITNVGNGWFRISASQSSCTTGTAYFQLGTILTSTSTQAQAHLGDGVSGVFIWGAQGELSSTVGTYCPTTSSANSAPRFNHTYNGTSWVSRGLLVEEQRTNLILYSNLQSSWYSINATLASTTETTSPDGTNNSRKLTEDTTASTYHYAEILSGSPPVSAGVTYTVSCFVKANGRTKFYIGAGTNRINMTTYFDLSNGTITSSSASSSSITNVGNGWYRCTATQTASATGATSFQLVMADDSSNPSYTGDGIKGVFIFGYQVEQAAFATSLIPTTSASVTRSADVCQITGTDFSGFWNGTEGAIAYEADSFSNSQDNQVVFQASDGTLNNQYQSARSQNNAYTDIGFWVKTGNVWQSLIATSSGAWNQNLPNKNAMAYKVNDFAFSNAGSTVLTDTSGTIPTVDRINIGASVTSAGSLNGHIARLRYFNKRLPNATLQLLSEPDPTLNLQFALNKTLTPVAGPTPSLSRASTGTFFNASGVLTSASINTPRFDHVYSGGQWVSRGLLIEEQRTNLLPRSEEFNTGWTNNDINISTNSVTAPDGTLTADNLVPNTVNTNHRLYQGPAGSGVASVSIFAKSTGYNWLQVRVGAGGGTSVTVNFDIVNGAIGDTVLAGGATASGQSIENVGNGWWRCKFTTASVPAFTTVIMPRPDNASAEGLAYAGDGVKGVAVWGAQLENASFPTSYIPTTTTSVVRSADVCQITGTSFGSMWNQGEGSVAIEAGTFSDSSYLGRYLEFTRTSSVGSPSIGVGTINSAGSAGGDNVYNYVWDSSTQAALYASPARPLAKSSFAWKVNDFAASINGATALTDTSGTVPTGIDVLTIGSRYGSLNIINGHIAKLIYYPARLTNAKLQQLST